MAKEDPLEILDSGCPEIDCTKAEIGQLVIVVLCIALAIVISIMLYTGKL